MLKNKSIVVIGGGESAVDYANRLAQPELNNEVYLSLHSGIRVSPRYHPNTRCSFRFLAQSADALDPLKTFAIGLANGLSNCEFDTKKLLSDYFQVLLKNQTLLICLREMKSLISFAKNGLTS